MFFWHVPSLVEVKSVRPLCSINSKMWHCWPEGQRVVLGQRKWVKARWGGWKERIIPDSGTGKQKEDNNKKGNRNLFKIVFTPPTNVHLTTWWTLFYSRVFKLSRTHSVFTSGIICTIQCNKCPSCFHVVLDQKAMTRQAGSTDGRLFNATFLLLETKCMRIINEGLVWCILTTFQHCEEIHYCTWHQCIQPLIRWTPQLLNMKWLSQQGDTIIIYSCVQQATTWKLSWA